MTVSVLPYLFVIDQFTASLFKFSDRLSHVVRYLPRGLKKQKRHQVMSEATQSKQNEEGTILMSEYLFNHADDLAECSEEANPDETRQLEKNVIHVEKRNARTAELDMLAMIRERDDQIQGLQAELRETNEYLMMNRSSISEEDAFAQLKEMLEESRLESARNHEVSRRLLFASGERFREVVQLESANQFEELKRILQENSTTTRSKEEHGKPQKVGNKV